jgi:hypothetical protein
MGKIKEQFLNNVPADQPLEEYEDAMESYESIDEPEYEESIIEEELNKGNALVFDEITDDSYVILTKKGVKEVANGIRHKRGQPKDQKR